MFSLKLIYVCHYAFLELGMGIRALDMDMGQGIQSHEHFLSAPLNILEWYL